MEYMVIQVYSLCEINLEKYISNLYLFCYNKLIVYFSNATLKLFLIKKLINKQNKGPQKLRLVEGYFDSITLKYNYFKNFDIKKNKRALKNVV